MYNIPGVPKQLTILLTSHYQVLAEAEDAEDRTATLRAQCEQNEDLRDFDEADPIEGETPLVGHSDHII